MVYWLNTGIPWRDLPERFGPGKAYTVDFVHGQKPAYGDNVLAQLIQQDIVDGNDLNAGQHQRLRYISMPAVVKKGRQRVKRSQAGED